MAKAHVHAESSARKYGGQAEDYLDIHLLMDSSKSTFADNRHRCLTHNAWFISVVLPRVFGDTITNSDDKVVSVKDVGEQHVLEDYGMRFIPTAQDFLEGLEWSGWMDNGRGGFPPSHRKLAARCQQPKPISLEEMTVDVPNNRTHEGVGPPAGGTQEATPEGTPSRIPQRLSGTV